MMVLSISSKLFHLSLLKEMFLPKGLVLQKRELTVHQCNSHCPENGHHQNGIRHKRDAVDSDAEYDEKRRNVYSVEWLVEKLLWIFFGHFRGLMYMEYIWPSIGKGVLMWNRISFCFSSKHLSSLGFLGGYITTSCELN